MYARFQATAWQQWNWARRTGKHVLVEKPMAVDLETAAQMIEVARAAGIQLGVVSQHRFDDSTLFLKRAIAAGSAGPHLAGRRLREVAPHGRILRAACEGKLEPAREAARSSARPSTRWTCCCT
jgi:hypothetical protein